MKTGLSFTSNINFVSNEEFQRKTAYINKNSENENKYIGVYDKNNKYCGDMYFYNKAKTDTEGLTDDIQSCVAGGLSNKNSKELTFFHFVPAAINSFDTSVKPKIFDGLTKMKTYTDELGGLIIGGKSGKSCNANCVASTELAKKFKTFFDELKASYSEISGQNMPGGKTAAYYNGNEDTWYINCENKEEPYKNQINSAEDIKKAYNKIKIAKKDNVFINYQKTDKLELEEAFKRIPGGFQINPIKVIKDYYEIKKKGFDFEDRIKIYNGGFGDDKKTLWVESSKPREMEVVIKNLEKIKQSDMFKEIEKIQYAGNEQIQGFEPTDIKAENKIVYEKRL